MSTSSDLRARRGFLLLRPPAAAAAAAADTVLLRRDLQLEPRVLGGHSDALPVLLVRKVLGDVSAPAAADRRRREHG